MALKKLTTFISLGASAALIIIKIIIINYSYYYFAMDKYKLLKALGEGTFGSVTKAVNTTTNDVVAIKGLKST